MHAKTDGRDSRVIAMSNPEVLANVKELVA